MRAARALLHILPLRHVGGVVFEIVKWSFESGVLGVAGLLFKVIKDAGLEGRW